MARNYKGKLGRQSTRRGRNLAAKRAAQLAAENASDHTRYVIYLKVHFVM